ncbi:hypothetical protein QTP88_028932 [Uroleucon formosanum]
MCYLKCGGDKDDRAVVYKILFDDENAIDDEVIAMQRRPKIFYERVNYLELYNNHDFINRYRLSKATFNTILRSIENEISLYKLTTGSFLLCVADFTEVSESSACRYVHQVCRAIARQRRNFISFLSNAIDRNRVVNGFYTVDCTHIKIQSPGGDNAEVFRNRKGWFSINTQCIYNPWVKIMDIVVNYMYNESHIRTRNVIERCFGVMKRRFPVHSKGLTVNLNNTQAIIVACAVLHNICVDMHDELPDDELMENNFINDVNENHIGNLVGTRGRQEIDRLINDHFAHRRIFGHIRGGA